MAKRQPRGLKPDHLYVVQQRNADDLYAVSPDGEGVFWYETDEELDEAYGEGNFSSCTSLTMDEFEELRYPEEEN